jgi:type I restriction-modification system DNA methylase subunit
MDKATAQRIVRYTFKAGFDRKRYRDFINEVCNGFDESTAQNMGVPAAFTPHIKSCQRLGTFESPEGELADVLIVQLTESYKLERTRTALRDFVAHALKRGEGGENLYKEAGLVAFVAPDSESWRFSYVRMEYETKRNPKTGKIRAEERLTPARRYSYLVGADEECHTAQTRFLVLLQNTSDSPTLAQIEEAFSVESVTKEFFREYARLFEDTEGELAAIVKRNKSVRDEFKAKGVNTVDFSKKLLGQIVFLYFVQKKGWLGVAKGGKWGDGPRNFMRVLSDRAMQEKKHLFTDILEPLFYDTLATDRGHEAWCATFQCRIPFLNGGLFEPLAGYEWETADIDLPNTLFTNKQLSLAGDTGTGILDVFDRYNFTVNEAEPLEKEVAIDPEMLGKVFENLIEENRRKGLGAYYTPREIVHYMCQESLINYLDNGLNCPTKPIGAATPPPENQPPLFINSAEKRKPKLGQLEFTEPGSRTVVSRADLVIWIQQSDQFAHYAAAIAAGTKGDHYPKPPDSIRKYAQEIDALLRDITVCDPAIGSGAFPVGMMTEIIRARTALTPYFKDLAERSVYHLKRHTIQNSLYGVDIDIGAVEIAKLRLWLSLVVDEEDVQNIQPLPNLDYKIVAGNSLLGVEKTLFNQEKFNRLEELKPKFFNESDRKKKAQFKRQIEALIHELTNGREDFDFEIYFSEVFHAKNGFDVVIANPPYVSVEKFARTALQTEWKRKFKTYASRGDIYCFFYEKGLSLLHEGGLLTFISSNKFQRAGYGKGLRQLLTSQRIRTLIDFCELPVFAAATDPMIVIVEKAAGAPPVGISVLVVKDQAEFGSLQQSVTSRASRYMPDQLRAEGWSLEGVDGLALVEKLRANGTALITYVKRRIYYGIKTGLNEAFVIDRDTRARLIREDRKSAELIKPWIRGKDIKRWTHEFHDLYVIVFPHGFHSELKKYPAILRHLTVFQTKLKARGQCKTSRGSADEGQHHWLELDNNPSKSYIEAFDEPKIVFNETSKRLHAYLDSEGNAINKTGFIILSPEAHFVLAVLNSTPLDWLYRSTFPSWGDPWNAGRVQFRGNLMNQVPIPAASPADKARLTKLAERAAKLAKGGDVTALATVEKEIDDIVYRLFDLTTGEMAQIETALEMTHAGISEDEESDEE